MDLYCEMCQLLSVYRLVLAGLAAHFTPSYPERGPSTLLLWSLFHPFLTYSADAPIRPSEVAFLLSFPYVPLMGYICVCELPLQLLGLAWQGLVCLGLLGESPSDSS